jgi:hypothetical protein
MDLDEEEEFRDAGKKSYKFLATPFLALNVTSRRPTDFNSFTALRVCSYLLAITIARTPTRTVTDIHTNSRGMHTKQAALS